MPESYSSTHAVASAVTTRSPAAAVSFTGNTVDVGHSVAEYPWWRPDRRPGEIELFVHDEEIDVVFEEPLR